MEWLEDLIPYMRVGDIDLKEDIGNFWQAMSAEDRRWSIKEEEYAREKLHGMKTMTDDAYEKLLNFKSAVNEKHTLKGLPSYDILRDPVYQQSFQYFSPAIENRSDFIIDDDSNEENDHEQSDMVRSVISLAYVRNLDGLYHALKC